MTTTAGSTATTTCQCGRHDGTADNEHAFLLMNDVPRSNDWQVFLQILRDKPDILASPSEVIKKLFIQETDLRRKMGLDWETSLLSNRGEGAPAEAGEKVPTGRLVQIRRVFQGRAGPAVTVTRMAIFRCIVTAGNAAILQRPGLPVSMSVTIRRVKQHWSRFRTHSPQSSIFGWQFPLQSDKLTVPQWFVHGGCSAHICGPGELFVDYMPYPPETQPVRGFNGASDHAAGYGKVRLITRLPD